MKHRLRSLTVTVSLALLLAACGSGGPSEPSAKLTDGETSFCGDLPHDALLANEEAKKIAEEKHWDYDSDAMFADDLFRKASSELGGFNPQTPELSSRLKSTSDAFEQAMEDTDFVSHSPDPSPSEVSDADAASKAFTDLQAFCNANT